MPQGWKKLTSSADALISELCGSIGRQRKRALAHECLLNEKTFDNLNDAWRKWRDD